eukprot:scaffold41306_cov56-Phaeocystis_antarctica.AAC.6
MRWGYADDLSSVRHSYGTGEAGKRARQMAMARQQAAGEEEEEEESATGAAAASSALVGRGTSSAPPATAMFGMAEDLQARSVAELCRVLGERAIPLCLYSLAYSRTYPPLAGCGARPGQGQGGDQGAEEAGKQGGRRDGERRPQAQVQLGRDLRGDPGGDGGLPPPQEARRHGRHGRPHGKLQGCRLKLRPCKTLGQSSVCASWLWRGLPAPRAR